MTSDPFPQNQWLPARRGMVEDQIRARGVNDRRVLEAMLAIPREIFVPPEARASAYDDRALQIGHGQTISQPFIVAYMTERLAVAPDSRVLEIGTGSGYQCAVLARLAGYVYSVERLDVLRERAAANLAAVGAVNVTLRAGDGSLGLAEFAPYDRIIVTAAAPRIPQALVDQLADAGRLVMPVGGWAEQTIVSVVRDGPRTIETPSIGCRFVKLIGGQAWSEDDAEE